MMLSNEYDPWSMPDDYTVWKMAPDYVKPLLPPHWQTQKAVHPFFSYFCGLYLLVVGMFKQHNAVKYTFLHPTILYFTVQELRLLLATRW